MLFWDENLLRANQIMFSRAMGLWFESIMFNVFPCAMVHNPISGPVVFCSHFASLSGPWSAVLWPSGSGSKNTRIIIHNKVMKHSHTNMAVSNCPCGFSTVQCTTSIAACVCHL